MIPQETLRVAIIGAGIGGLATAVALRLEGFVVDVYEQAATLKEIGAAVIIRPESVEILENWGLAEGYAQYRTPIPELNILKGATGQRMRVLGFQRQTGNVDSIHRVDLHNLLSSQVPAEAIHLSRKCQSVREHASYVEILFTDGSSECASIVIAADGIHSAIRPFMNKEKDTAVFSGMQGHRSVLPREHVADLLSQDIPCMWIKGSKSFFLLLPVQNGAGVAFDALLPVSQESEESWNSTIEPDELITRLEGFDPAVQEVVRRTEGSIGVFGLYDREPTTYWNTAHVALLGDAAHPMLPFEGQGANQAIQDAAVLAECLRGIQIDGIPAALEHYSRRRIPTTRKIQLQSRLRLHHPVRSMLYTTLSQLAFQLKTVVRPAGKGKTTKASSG